MTRCDSCLCRYGCDAHTEETCRRNGYANYVADIERHGHWEIYYTCSRCGETVREAVRECPCCHATMDGKDI